ncbi:MAG: PKD domain-containing protein [bacterium]
MKPWKLIPATLIFALILPACSGRTIQQPPESRPDLQQQVAGFPAGLPEDRLQPWEQPDENGNVIVTSRSGSAINRDSEFIAGVERFSSSGDVSDNGEASRIISLSGGSAYAQYRIPLGGGQPGAVGIDANLVTGKGYFIGIADYASGRWQWHGPFTDNHVRLSTAASGPLASPLGNMFVSVLVHDGAALDCVGIGWNPVDPLDKTAPDIPHQLSLSALASGVQLGFEEVLDPDLAGYRMYFSKSEFISGAAAGVSKLGYLEGSTEHFFPATPGEELFVRVSAIDFSGNQSALSQLVSATALEGRVPDLTVTLDRPSAMLQETVSLHATGADSYDFDLDGDGSFEILGSSSGSFAVATDRLGIIRPAVRGHGVDATAVALGSVSLLISGNSRPVAQAQATPASGIAPLDVSFSGTDSTDFDGTIAGGGWDFDGDGTYDVWDDTDIVHVTSANHTYAAPGLYNARLRVVDDGGAWDVDTLAILVSSPADPDNIAPTADLQVDLSSGDAPLSVSFNASGSIDPDGSIVEYAWDWDGDGLYDAIGEAGSAMHVYAGPGIFNATLRVEDNDGARDTASIEINVNVAGNELPSASLSVDNELPQAGNMVRLDASASLDPDGSIARYEWDFDGDGNWDANGSSPSATHTYLARASYRVRLRVTDDMGAQAETGKVIKVSLGPWSLPGYDTMNNRQSPNLGAQTSAIRWSYLTPNVVSGELAVTPEGTIYAGCWNGRLYALNHDGFLQWTYTSAEAITAGIALGSDGTLYFGSDDNFLHAVLPDGRRKWRFATGDDVRSSPTIAADGTVLFGSLDNKFYAVNPDGTLKWSFTAGNDILGPAAAIDPDGRIYFCSDGGSLYVLDPDGSLAWQYDPPSGVRGAPAIDGNGIVYVANAGNLRALNPGGSEHWTYQLPSGGPDSPSIAADGTIIFGSSSGIVYALHPDGTMKWQFPMLQSASSTPVIGSDGTVYIGSADQNMYAIDQDGSLKWKITGGFAFPAGAAVIGADGVTYFGQHEHEIFAVGN